MPVHVLKEAGVATLAMELPRGNAIGLAFLDEMNQALDAAGGDDVRGVVVTGKGRAFCGGLNLLETFDFDRPKLERFVDAFDAFFQRLYALPKPTAAAINGHGIAGGCILALACDRRVMARGDFALAITEIELGIPFPAAAMEIARQGMSPAAWTDAFLAARRYNPDDALAAGLVHAVAAPERLVEDARAALASLADQPPRAFAQVKADLQAPVLERISVDRALRRQRFVDAWFGPVSTEKRKAIRDGLLARKSG